MSEQELQAQRNAEHVMFSRLAHKAREAGRHQLADTYEQGMAMIARLYQKNQR